MKILSTFLDIIFPSYCISCKKRGSFLCFDCLSVCKEAERESANWIIPLFDYREPIIKKSIWSLKYSGKSSLAKVFTETMYPRILEELADLKILENFTNPILIPIPLSKTRLRERGFNQATLICDELVKLDKNINFKLEKNILIKIKDVEHQARLKDRNIRLKNIIGSFAVKNPTLIKKRNIILIDDVTTTGATLNEAKKILKQAGARKIISFTIAH